MLRLGDQHGKVKLRSPAQDRVHAAKERLVPGIEIVLPDMLAKPPRADQRGTPRWTQADAAKIGAEIRLMALQESGVGPRLGLRQILRCGSHRIARMPARETVVVRCGRNQNQDFVGTNNRQNAIGSFDFPSPVDHFQIGDKAYACDAWGSGVECSTHLRGRRRKRRRGRSC